MLLKFKEEPLDDIVFGVVAPIGADVERLVNVLKKELSAYDYSGTTIRLSALLDLSHGAAPADSTHSKSSKLMDLGDDLRKRLETGDAVAGLAVARISKLRKVFESSDRRRKKKAWILRTLKHPAEVELLQKIYGSHFITVSVNETENSRRDNLERLIGRRDPMLLDPNAEAATLLSRDESSGEKLGQNVRATNQQADFYLEVGKNLVSDTKRMVGLLFGHPFETPTRDEQSMFHAFATSLRSADPGRQVGAVITSKGGEIIAVGTNDVPSPGGGQYWSGDSDDQRDFQLGRDNNKWHTNLLLQELFDALAHEDVLRSEYVGMDSERRYKEITSKAKRSLSKTRATALIEFGRITHAEMSVISDCARSGKPVEGGIIYVTAFPCHMCMRLIIASGIQRIVYVDPYPKSLAVDMYKEALSFGDTHKTDKINVNVFRGASSRIFERVFTMINRTRNEDGSFEWFDKKVLPFRSSGEKSLNSIQHLENLVVGELVKKVSEMGDAGCHQDRFEDILRHAKEQCGECN